MGMRKDFHASSGDLPKGPGPAGAFSFPVCATLRIVVRFPYRNKEPP